MSTMSVGAMMIGGTSAIRDEDLVAAKTELVVVEETKSVELARGPGSLIGFAVAALAVWCLSGFAALALASIALERWVGLSAIVR